MSLNKVKTARGKHRARGVKLCIAKGQYTENRTAKVQMSGTVFIHNLALSSSFRHLRQYLLWLLQLRFCPTVQLGLSLWPWELDKAPWSWRRHWLFHSSETLLVERVDRFKSLSKLLLKSGGNSEGLQKSLPLTIFLCSPSVLCEGTPLGEIF